MIDSAQRDDRRGSPRVLLQVEVSLTSAAQLYTGITGDISTGGVFVVTYRPEPVGSVVELELALPTATVTAKGVVTWRREASEGAEPGFGVAFLKLDDATREAIESFCRQREPMYVEIDRD